jgi:hypothetical protein
MESNMVIAENSSVAAAGPNGSVVEMFETTVGVPRTVVTSTFEPPLTAPGGRYAYTFQYPEGPVADLLNIGGRDVSDVATGLPSTILYDSTDHVTY